MALRDAWKGLFLKKNMPTQRPQGNEIGWSGNRIFSGLPMDEYNSDLAWPKSVQVYDQMRRSDGQVAAVLMALKLPIRSTEWFIDEDKDVDDGQSALSEQVKEFVEDNLFGGMQYSWDDHLREALLMLDFGISVFETVWKYDTWNGRKAIMLDKYAPRVVTSLWRFPQDANYNIAAVEQINYMTGEIKTMPLDRCRVYTYNREGENPVGISALRPAYKHWYIKDALYKIMTIGIEKSLIGTPYAKMPVGANLSDEDRNKILNLLTATRVSDQAGFTIPGNVELGMLESAKNAVDAMPFIEHQDTLIARSLLAQFINLGTMSSASGGSYALGQTQVDLFCMGLEAIATYIEGEIQKDIEKLVLWNFGPDAPMVYLHHKKVQFADVNQVAAALAALGSGHLLIPDEDVENRIREMFNLPPISKTAMSNQRMLPENRYVPDVVPDEATPGLQNAHQPGVPEQPGQAQPAQQSPDAQKKTVAAHEHEHGHMFDDALATKWRRDLTNWEKPVQFEDINQTWTNAENQYQDTVRQGLTQMTNSMLSQIQSIVDSSQTATQKTNAINALTGNMPQKYVDALVAQSQGLYTYGAGQVANELNATASGSISQADAAAIKAQVVTSVNSLVNNIVNKVKLYALSQLHRGVATKQLLFGTKQAATAFIDGGAVKTTGTITVSESINIGRGAEAKKIGIVGAQYSAIMDDHTCPLCAELDMHQISVDDPDFDVFRPPLHPNCLVGDSLVTSSTPISGVSKRWFDGNVIVIETSKGFKLTCTPNHPILTNRGWVAAGSLNIGDNVVCDGVSERRGFVDGNHKDVPTRIEDIANTFLSSSEVVSGPVPVSTEDFHGDGVGSKVAIIGADRSLLLEDESTLCEHHRNLLLKLRNSRESSLTTERTSALLVEGNLTTDDSSMSGRNLIVSSVDRHLRPLESFGSTSTSNVNIGTFESQTNRGTTDTERFGDAVLGFTGYITTNNIVNVDSDLPTIAESRLSNSFADERSGYAKLASDILTGSTGDIFLDEIVNIQVDSFHGFVYNLQTESGFYTANNIITHNCRCVFIYINKEEDNVEFNWKSPSGELVQKYGNLVK